MNPIYFDYLATTPVDPAVAAEMARYLSIDGAYGNAASRSHRLGWEAEQAVENARRQVASLLNADVREIVWTSGATESDNLAIKGVVQGVMQESRQPDRGDVPHVVTSAIEHKAVLDSCAFLESQGVKVTYLAPDEKGLIAPHAVAAAITPNTSLVSIMHANNEIGTINDIAAISKITREANVVFHVDAAQSVGKIPVDVKALDVDLLSLSAHKFYGPKGMGVLYVRRGFSAPLVAQIHGGGHERGMRSGTLATHQIVGIGKAAELANSKLAEESARLAGMRDSLLSQLSDIDGISLNGDDTHRLPGALNISVANVEGEALLLSLSEFALSTGSACTSASMEPSYVLRALGLDDVLAHSSLRVSLGRFTTLDEIAQFSQRMHEIVPRLRRDAA